MYPFNTDLLLGAKAAQPPLTRKNPASQTESLTLPGTALQCQYRPRTPAGWCGPGFDGWPGSRPCDTSSGRQPLAQG